MVALKSPLPGVHSRPTSSSGDACKATCGGCEPTREPTRDDSSAAPTRRPTTATRPPAPEPTTEPDAESAAAPTFHRFLFASLLLLCLDP